MKIGGKKVSAFNEDVVVIPRSGIDEEGNEKKDIVFKFRPCKDFDDFTKLCPLPAPPMMIMAGETEKRPVHDDEDYKKRLTEHQNKQMAYMFLNSISATPGLEFESASLTKPETWNAEVINKELTESGLSFVEVNKLWEAAVTVNSLNDVALEAARARFLATEKARVRSQLLRQDEQPST